jgi:histidine phosphotransfer protein HptB
MDKTMNTTHLAVDISRLNEISDGDSEFENELILMFLEDCPQRFTTLQGAVTLMNWELIRKEAHGLKGASGNMGANQMQFLAAAVEKAPEETTSEEILRSFEALCDEYARVESFFRAHLDR